MAGGLDEQVDEKVLHAAFVPFGEVVDINMPLDYESGTGKNILFVDYI